jgi:excisionase family DNA binding protein
MTESRKDFDEPYVTVHEAAKHVNLAVGSVYQKVSKGEIPYYKLRGYGVRFLLSELDRWQAGDLDGGLRGAVPAGVPA